MSALGFAASSLSVTVNPSCRVTAPESRPTSIDVQADTYCLVMRVADVASAEALVVAATTVLARMRARALHTTPLDEDYGVPS